MRLRRTTILANALASGDFVRLNRRFETGYVRGYVLAMGRSHFLLALVSDRVCFDGYECFRIKDVKSVEIDPYRAFAEAALSKRGLCRPSAPSLSMETTRTILESASSSFSLITIHREEIAPDVCHIGKVIATNRTQVAILEIGPDAVWDERATAYSLREVTRINFGGGYEDALALVGGTSGA